MVMLSPDEFMQNQYVKILINIMGITEYFQLLPIKSVDNPSLATLEKFSTTLAMPEISLCTPLTTSELFVLI